MRTKMTIVFDTHGYGTIEQHNEWNNELLDKGATSEIRARDRPSSTVTCMRSSAQPQAAEFAAVVEAAIKAYLTPRLLTSSEGG